MQLNEINIPFSGCVGIMIDMSKGDNSVLCPFISALDKKG